MTATSTLTLTEFLLARIAEDEAEARRWIERRKPWNGESFAVFFAGSEERVLAECEAKRRIAEDHRGIEGKWSGDPGPYCASCGDQGCCGHGEEWPCPTLRLLAKPYADHPDYREDEWRI